MSHTLTVNTARSNVHTALVAAIAQPYTPKAFPTLTFGETIDIELYLVTEGGAIDARSGTTGYTPRVSVLLPTLQPTDGAFTITASVDSYIVSGAGTTESNGTYIRNGDSATGYPAYTLYTNDVAQYNLWHYDGSWYITETAIDDTQGALQGGLYASETTSTTPPEDGWIVGFGDSPAPTLTQSTGTITADYNVGAQDLETALNAMNDGAGPFNDQCTVTKFADGTFSILFDTVGDKSELIVSASGIQPTSAASVLPLVEGDATTREEQLIRILAEPLVFEDSATQITDGWSMTLNANNANILRATAAEQGDLSANYSIEVVAPTAAVDVVARGPVIIKEASFDVAALSGINYPDFPTDETSTTTVTDAIYSVTSTDQSLLVNNDDGATIFLLPASVAGDGKELTIKNIGLGDVTISGSIDGQTSVVLQSAGKPSITIISDASTWNVI